MQWHEIEDIVHALEEHYPEIDIEELTLPDLRDLILDLQEFSDDPDAVKDSGLKKLKESWIEYREEQGDDQED
ncbi:MAG: Fe-S cluster assembly protein IscX [Rickettsiaceae bacterium]|nr:Fe-S cluster assembly protein IscX [Rickettsiaceae bacterium]